MLGIKPQFPDGMRMGSDYHDVPYSLQAARGGGSLRPGLVQQSFTITHTLENRGGPDRFGVYVT